MASSKLLIIAVTLAIIFFSATAIEFVNAEEQLSVNEEAPLIEGAKKIASIEEDVTARIVTEGEALLKACANKHIKSCEQGRICNQVICPTEAEGDYACLPKGDQYLPFRKSVCNGEFTVIGEAPKKPASPTEEREVIELNPIFLLPIFIAFLIFAYNRLASGLSIKSVPTEEDLEAIKLGKVHGYNDFSDLNQTMISEGRQSLNEGYFLQE
mmetsp:Transcript_7027/g.7893  ORF Transcript_7027/g.7893 Transcript_7027/m.7893 type:complete len:212 (+) Transcript_7027:1-636(+)